MRYWLLGILLVVRLLGEAQDFYNLDDIPEIRLTFVQADWAQQLDVLKRATDKERLVADMKINDKEYKQVGVRYKGNSSYFSTHNDKYQKLPFNIKVGYSDKALEIPVGIKTIKLSNVFRDPSFVREVLAYEIARQYMPAPQCNFAKLYINGMFWGLYTNTESIDEHFLKTHFGESDGPFFKCDPPDWQSTKNENCQDGENASLTYIGEDWRCYQNAYELESKDSTDWQDLIALSKIITQKPNDIERVLDVDQTLWMLAFNNVLVNLDSYTGRLCHNYYIYRKVNGQFVPLVWDLNMAFGGFRFSGIGGVMTDLEMQEMSPFIHYKEKTNRQLVANLLSNNLYRKIYVAHIRTILEEHFKNGAYIQRAKLLQNKIDEWVKADTKKLYPYTTFKSNLDSTATAGNSAIIGLTQLMEARTKFLLAHPVLKKIPPTIVKHECKQTADGALTISATCAEATQVWVFFRKQRDEVFQKSEMVKITGTSVWQLQIPNPEKLQYYFVAEDNVSAALSPARAAFEFHEFVEGMKQ